MLSLKHPLTVTLRVPPLPLSGGEETPISKATAVHKLGFLSPGQGERWTGEAGTVRGCFVAPLAAEAHP
jgi:hypothetical protein